MLQMTTESVLLRLLGRPLYWGKVLVGIDARIHVRKVIALQDDTRQKVVGSNPGAGNGFLSFNCFQYYCCGICRSYTSELNNVVIVSWVQEANETLKL